MGIDGVGPNEEKEIELNPGDVEGLESKEAKTQLQELSERLTRAVQSLVEKNLPEDARLVGYVQARIDTSIEELKENSLYPKVHGFGPLVEVENVNQLGEKLPGGYLLSPDGRSSRNFHDDETKAALLEKVFTPNLILDQTLSPIGRGIMLKEFGIGSGEEVDWETLGTIYENNHPELEKGIGSETLHNTYMGGVQLPSDMPGLFYIANEINVDGITTRHGKFLFGESFKL